VEWNIPRHAQIGMFVRESQRTGARQIAAEHFPFLTFSLSYVFGVPPVDFPVWRGDRYVPGIGRVFQNVAG